MSSAHQRLTDVHWERLKPHLPYGSTGKRGRNANNRLFIDALLWMARSGDGGVICRLSSGAMTV